jgi:hypothetical protein
MNKANLIYMAGLLALILLFVPLRRAIPNDWLFVGGAVSYLVALRVTVALLAKRGSGPRDPSHRG